MYFILGEKKKQFGRDTNIKFDLLNWTLTVQVLDKVNVQLYVLAAEKKIQITYIKKKKKKKILYHFSD